MEKKFDVLVVGGGHAGAEAAYAAARMGHSVGLVTHDSRSIGRMSCNPAIGGVGKGQLAREIDALGGLMGVAADASGIQFRLLNTSKGRAVQSPRAQCCRLSYEERVQEVLENSSEIEFIDAEASHLRKPAPCSDRSSLHGYLFGRGSVYGFGAMFGRQGGGSRF